MQSSAKDIILRETFEGGLKYSLYSNFRKWTEAFLELMDNAVSNRMPGTPISITILSSPKKLEISNSGGYGMDIKELEEFLQWGKIKPRRNYDLGAYSQGGKAAMGYLGRAMKVTASPHGKDQMYILEDNNLHDYALKSFKVMTIDSFSPGGLVKIEITGLRRKINEEELVTLVSDIYRPLILDGSVNIKHNGREITVTDFPLDATYDRQKFSFTDTQMLPSGGHDKNLMVHGWIGRLTSRSGIKGGMRCYKLGRLISDREFFGQPDAHYKQTLNFLFGEVYLDHVPATTNKTDFDRDSTAWRDIQDRMFMILQPHIDDLLGRDIQEPSDEEKERVKTARELVAELIKLRKIELEGSATIDVRAYGQKPKENEGIGRVYERKNKRQNSPKTPPPPDAIGKRKRLKEFLDWSIRPMDDAIRSIIEETSGKNTLVINNLFSGFKVAKGQTLYLIETAAIQLSKPDKDEKMTVEEYMESFDSLYSFFCTNLDSAKESIQKKKTKARV